jgi:outer membrane protein insertion porin family
MKTKSFLFFVLFAACSAPVPRDAAIDPPASAHGPRVVFEGNAGVPSSELLSVMSIGDAPVASQQDTLERDVLMLVAAYYYRGYLRVSIDTPAVKTAADGSYSEIRIRISEGARYRVGKLTIADEAAPLPGFENMRAMVRQQDGAMFSFEHLVRDLRTIRTRYRDAGYANVDAEPLTQSDDTNKTVEIDIPVKRGELTYVDHVLVVGTDASAIEKHILIGKGDLFSETKLTQTMEALQSTGLFDHIDISTEDKPSKTRCTVRIEVKER